MANDQASLWGIHAGRDGSAESLFLAKGYIALGWAITGNLAVLPDDSDPFRQLLATKQPQDSVQSIATVAGMLRRFVYGIKTGDAVVCRPESMRDLVFLGRVAGPYIFNPFVDQHFPHLRRVEWLRSVPPTRFSPDARDQLSHRLTLVKITDHTDEYISLLLASV